MLSQGSSAPAFSAPDQDGKIRSLKDFLGQWVLLYFYPKDDTPGCTKEACGFRDVWKDLKEKGIVILGVSKDSSESHKKFADKFALPFPLLADPDKKIIEAYEAWGQKKFLGKEYMGTLRISYLIDPEGKIAKVYDTVKPEEHPGEVVRDWEILAKA